MGNFTNIHLFNNQLSSVQSLRYIWRFVTPWIAACQVSLSITTSGTWSNSCPLMSVMSSNHLILFIPFFIQSSSGSILMSQFFASGSQNIGASLSTSMLPMNIQNWFPLHWLVWSPCSPRVSQESSPAPQLKSVLQQSAFFMVQLSSLHDYWKSHSFN